MDEVPNNFPDRVKRLRGRLGLTQMQMAERIGVSFATVNRWENRQSRPNRLAWRGIVDLESETPAPGNAPHPPPLDFGARPEAVTAVAAATRLSWGHLANPAFASEISLIDPLPHQRIAVYEHMLEQSPLRFLLADDAGAGKTIMTGLQVREMLVRRLIRRVLVVPPAGLVGNWEREMRTLFRLPFHIVRGADARAGNPFVGPESDLAIISIDTLAVERMFGWLRDARPYDLVVFDEAHKLSAHLEDGRMRKTRRYQLAEALAGVNVSEQCWRLGWSAPHLLLLTATPHMGREFPYFALWRLLAPEALANINAFRDFPEDQRQRHFIRRTKEEMVRSDGRPLYPQRNCDTLSHDLNPEEQELYEATTRYLEETWNKARHLNRSAARLAMSVFQRRLASSTYALMRSFERRIERLGHAIGMVEAGRGGELEREQIRIAGKPDFFETETADADADDDGGGEKHEAFEKEVLGGFTTVFLKDLREERDEVADLLARTRRLEASGEDSRFEKLREVMDDREFAREKLIVFTEHRDTAEFLVRRLEGLGYTGQVALIHGGLGYPEREEQVELFRRSADEGGARCLVATDAAGEGINLQFCWLMVNYDIPWNPARLEQRMGRIHRYGQKRDPVVIVNLVAGETREGQVLKVLLDKLEAIRKEFSSDKVFDVVGRLFENTPLRDYLERAATGGGASEALRELEEHLTPERMAALDRRERSLYGTSEVGKRLPELNKAMEREEYRRLLPGHVHHFVETTAPFVDLRLEGDAGGGFRLASERPGADDEMLAAMDDYPASARGRLTFQRPQAGADAIWLHPGEPVFECFRDLLLNRCGDEARRGAFFIDPEAEAPYLFHLARVSVVRQDEAHPGMIEDRPIGLRQEEDGAVSECPPEHLLLLRGVRDIAPGSIALARKARGLTGQAVAWLEECAEGLAEEHRRRVEKTLPEQRLLIARGYDHRTAELMTERQRVTPAARQGDQKAQERLAEIKEEQTRLAAERRSRLLALTGDPSRIGVGGTAMILHALVLPSSDPEEQKRHDTEVERIAMEFARMHEEAAGATVEDVSRPPLARRAGLGDNPGFDLLSSRPDEVEKRSIEVKGRAGTREIEIEENEWKAAANLEDAYWLYVVYDCDTPRPRLIKVRNPFRRLVARARGSLTISSRQIQAVASGDGA